MIPDALLLFPGWILLVAFVTLVLATYAAVLFVALDAAARWWPWR